MIAATSSNLTSNMNASLSTSNSRRNSFSSFVKNLLLLVSSTSSANNKQGDNNEQEPIENSPFQDLYFSFPAYVEEPTEESTASCGQSHHQSFLTNSSRIMC